MIFSFRIFAVVIVAFSMLHASDPISRTLENGDMVQWDGAYYDFRASDGRKMVKVWVPPEAKVVKGLMITGHGGGTGCSRSFPRDANFREYAARHDFGIAGLHWFPGREVYDSGQQVFFGALNEFALLGNHPELANVPFVVFGGSNGAATAYGLACSAPDRAIAFTSACASWWNPIEVTDEMINVPGLFMLGMFDPFTNGIEGAKQTMAHITNARKRGGKWSLIVSEIGHEDGDSWQIFTRFWERCIELRLPKDADPSKGPVQLIDIPEESGWLVDYDSWGSGFTTAASWNDYKGDREIAGWVPDADIAYLYRSVATYDNPIILTSPDLSAAFNPDTDWRSRLVGVANPAIKPGSIVRLLADADKFKGWKKIEFYDGARKLGKIKAGQKPELKLTVDGAQRLYNIHCIGYGADTIVRSSTPLYFYVSDPSIKLRSSAELARPVFENSARAYEGSKTAKHERRLLPDDTNSVLISYGLTPEHEKEWGKIKGELSSFWNLFDNNNHSEIRMNQKQHSTSGSKFSVVINHDARMTVRSVRSSSGLYLLFEVMDNRFVDVPSDIMYFSYDAVDFMLDSKSPSDIMKADINTSFVRRFWAITLSTIQYQAAMGEQNPPLKIRRNLPDPWDMRYELLSFDEMRKHYGVEVNYVNIDKFTRAQEWFIPWSAVGAAGISREPDMGKRIGFAPGYNDVDPGEHLPGSYDQLRWINRSSPWGEASQDGKAPLGWGAIEMGPMLTVSE